MYKSILFIVTLTLTTFVLYSQDKPIAESIEALIKNQLIKSDLKKIELLENEEQKALELMSEVDRQYEEISQIKQEVDSQTDKKSREKLLKKSVKIEEKAIRNHVEALKNLSNVYVNKYEILRKDIEKFPNSEFEKQAKELDDLKEKVYKCFENADLSVQKVYYTLNPNEVFQLFTEAYNQERLGFLYQQKIYSIYLKPDSAIVNDIDEKITGIILKKPDKRDQNKIGVTEIKDSVHFTEVIIFDTIKVEKVIESQMVYKVQIAASKRLLKIDELKAIYKEYNLIQSELENEWYKYTVGFFSYYQDAQNFKTRIGVPGAFIVAYKNGIKVPIKELTNHPSYTKSN